MTTEFGRIRRIPELRARNYQTRTLGERLAVNMVIQGTAADIIKVAMVRCRRGAARRRPEDPHWCCRSTTSCCSRRRRPRSSRRRRSSREQMADAFEMDPPLEVDVADGENWLAAK